MTNGVILALAGVGGSSGATGATGPTGPTGPAGGGGFPSTDPNNIITLGGDGGLYADLEGGSETGAPTDGSTYTQVATVGQFDYSIVLVPAGALTTLTVHFQNPFVSNPVFAPKIYLTLTQAVTTLTISGANISSGGLANVFNVPAGGKAVIYQWNNSVESGKWARIL